MKMNLKNGYENYENGSIIVLERPKTAKYLWKWYEKGFINYENGYIFSFEIKGI